MLIAHGIGSLSAMDMINPMIWSSGKKYKNCYVGQVFFVFCFVFVFCFCFENALNIKNSLFLEESINSMSALTTLGR